MLLLIINKTNSQIHLTKGLLREFSVQNFVHSRDMIRGIIRETINEKAAIKRLLSGADPPTFHFGGQARITLTDYYLIKKSPQGGFSY